MNKICKVVDEHVQDLRWVVELDNGEVIYQDDFRPGLEQPSAWIRLGDYVRENNLKIVGMEFQFRSHKVVLERDAEGYYFAKGALGFAGASETYHHFVAGVMKEGIIYKQWFQVPELEITQTGKQDASSCGLSLIRNDYAEIANRSLEVSV